MIRQAITANANAGRGIAAHAPPSIFDKTTFLEYVDDNLDHAQRTIDVLLRTLPDRLAAIRQAVAIKDSDALRSTAHSLKGSLAFIAAPVVVAAAFRLEMIGHSGDLADASAQYFELERAIVPLVAALQEFVREIRDAPTNAIAAASAPRHSLHLVGERR